MRYFLLLLPLLSVPIYESPFELVGADVPDEEMPTEADKPVGLNNGFLNDADFQKAMDAFSDVDGLDKGLGPVFNADSCAACHNHPVIGGGSITTELRAGRFDGTKFVPNSPSGSLIHARAVDPSIQPRVLSTSTLKGLRVSTDLRGLGFVECISNADLLSTIAAQPVGMKGEAVQVPILESGLATTPDQKRGAVKAFAPQSHARILLKANAETRVGRFGHKSQHASLLSFSADAHLNEMGITSPLLPVENGSNGRDVSSFDRGKKPNDQGGNQGFGEDVESSAAFMRSLHPPAPDAALLATKEAQAGLKLFRDVGCAICHRESFATAIEGTIINGGTFVVPKALGGKAIRPFSDFLLHDVGTGDGIPANGPQTTANKFRTMPLWGLRNKNRLGHDAATFTRHEMILHHKGEAAGVVEKYKALSLTDKQLLITFLRAL